MKNEIKTLSHSTCRCQYHIVLPLTPSITQGHISTVTVKSLSIYASNTKPVPLARPPENIFAFTGLSRVSPQKSLRGGPVLSPEP